MQLGGLLYFMALVRSGASGGATLSVSLYVLYVFLRHYRLLFLLPTESCRSGVAISLIVSFTSVQLCLSPSSLSHDIPERRRRKRSRLVLHDFLLSPPGVLLSGV